MSEVIYPDLLGKFIITLIGKGYQVRIDRDPIIDGVTIRVIKYGDVPYQTVRTMTFDELNSMTKDTQKIWFEHFIEWTEAEFKKFSI